MAVTRTVIIMEMEVPGRALQEFIKTMVLVGMADIERKRGIADKRQLTRGFQQEIFPVAHVLDKKFN